jgi:hypothetical protein
MKKIFLTALLIASTALGSFFIPDGSVTQNKPSIDFNSPFNLLNLGLSASVGSSQMTIALWANDDGQTSSALHPLRIARRNSTATPGGYTYGNYIGGAVTLVIPSGATLGQASAVSEQMYVYAQSIDSTNLTQLCVTTNGYFDEGSLQTSIVMNTSSDDRDRLYCTAGLTGAVRLVGRVTSTQGTAGTWATNPVEISVPPFASFVLAGSTAVQERTIRALVARAASPTGGCLNSTACTIYQASPPGVLTGTGTGTDGAYTLTFATGYFSAAPVCIASGTLTANAEIVQCYATSATSVTCTCYSAAGAADIVPFNIFCVGPK